MAACRIQVLKDAPYLVTGDFQVVDEHGNPVEGPRESVVALCRCGASATKPFCDGTHSAIGFCGDRSAPAE